MKNATLTLFIVLGMAALPAAAQKVTIDYAHEFDFTSVKTFQYVETKDTNTSNELMDERVKAAIIKELTEGGLTQTEIQTRHSIGDHGLVLSLVQAVIGPNLAGRRTGNRGLDQGAEFRQPPVQGRGISMPGR